MSSSNSGPSGAMAVPDAVQRQFIAALARRAARQPPGEAKRLLELRVAQLLGAEDVLQAEQHEGPHRLPHQAAPQPTGPLGHLARRLTGSDSTSPATPPLSAPELKTVRHFRQSWLQLSADRRLAESLAKAPANAGPLNSERLVQRALLLMRELSPAYLHRFLEHAEGLRWLDAARPRDG